MLAVSKLIHENLTPKEAFEFFTAQKSK